jgi:thiamine pyrophosphate-dependent acetolactate synthase large subunit-like protein
VTDPRTGRRLTLSELAKAIGVARGDAILVTGPGAVAGELYAAGPESPSIYNMELAYATPIALGLALTHPDRRVIAVEGDGSIVAGLGSLATVARYRPGNLTIVVVDNGIYGTGDNSVATQTAHGADLVTVGEGLGWPAEHVTRADDDASLAAALSSALPGPRLVIAAVDPASYSQSPSRLKPGVDVVESAVLLRLHLEGSVSHR